MVCTYKAALPGARGGEGAGMRKGVSGRGVVGLLCEKVHPLFRKDEQWEGDHLEQDVSASRGEATPSL